MAATWTRTITASADTVGQTLINIREGQLEDWLAEADSPFYPDALLLRAINWSHRELLKSMGGVDARWDIDTTVTAPYELAVPRDLIWYEKATYNPNGPTGAGVKELKQENFDNMFSLYGTEWIDDAAGTPETLYFRGWRTTGLYERASSVLTNGLSIFGRSVGVDFAVDGDRSVLPQQFDDGIAVGAFVYCLRRMGVQNGALHPLYQEAVGLWASYMQSSSVMARQVPGAEMQTVGSRSTRR